MEVQGGADGAEEEVEGMAGEVRTGVEVGDANPIPLATDESKGMEGGLRFGGGRNVGEDLEEEFVGKIGGWSLHWWRKARGRRRQECERAAGETFAILHRLSEIRKAI